MWHRCFAGARLNLKPGTNLHGKSDPGALFWGFSMTYRRTMSKWMVSGHYNNNKIGDRTWRRKLRKGLWWWVAS